MLFAKRPLSPEELYIAIRNGIQSGTVLAWDPTKITPEAIEEFILEASRGLTEITKPTFSWEKPRVQFIHVSVKDFLVREKGFAEILNTQKGLLEGESHNRLNDICMTYCLQYIRPFHIPEGLSTGEASHQKALTEFPFLEYACHNIIHHAEQAEKGGCDQKETIEHFPRGKWFRIANVLEPLLIRRYTLNASLLYILAEYNSASLIREHTSASSCLEVEEGFYRTPLFAAAAIESEETIQLFF